ncbi:hypothetical protein LY90DRAFT_524231 [Neocallimastix californiae]|uniref:Chitin synthase n=1 Tax=Neocallimastix californiae TaxID=1754190 RepID=A0A1Y2AW77_9FUNG|nr:hypothetical protein LY90DRAFT_524231 [Neocallimastix californiae]|eukprot:ORY26736.1 hypothetical protein LY90DRAFT_524231 [Neocallimastix californiae]
MLDNKYVGAATGDVKIYNTDSMLSFLSSLRYWFAFNLERSCQSFLNCVTCVSGPLGIYRSEVLNKILERWINQTFLGSTCTYGNDRHLTNLTLALGVSVKYTPFAICHTETPESYIRWVTQQTRWICPVQSLWMTYELIFHTIYPYILIYSLLTLIYVGNFWQLITRVLILYFMGGLKCIYALIITRDPKFILNFLYGIVYMIGFIPAKLQALLFLWDNGWDIILLS